MVEQNFTQKKRFIFLLLDNFSLISFACAVEPLRLANRYHSSEYYEWKSASETGKTAECSAGTHFQVDMGLEEINRNDTIIICGGINVKEHTSKPILN